MSCFPIFKEVEIKTKVKEKDGVTLTLTHEQAAILSCFLANIGINPQTEFFSKLYYDLENAGYPYCERIKVLDKAEIRKYGDTYILNKNLLYDINKYYSKEVK